MRLMKTDDLVERKEVVFAEFFGQPDVIKYAVLSHRWSHNELTYSQVIARSFHLDDSFTKVLGTARRAQHDGIPYIWIDSCCIDKQSSSELSEAINSMFKWYQGAEQCYVYLHDVSDATWQSQFENSEWFSRGWTLQELLAPAQIIFFSQTWSPLGTKRNLRDQISHITGIDRNVLRTGDLTQPSVAQKMSWASRRETTRLEDTAYCLLGIFDVNMPLLYGEGGRAFIRLQEEIIKNSDDHTIFAWDMKTPVSGLLAPDPSVFESSGSFEVNQSSENQTPYAMTNRGLSIEFGLKPHRDNVYLVSLNVFQRHPPNFSYSPLGIFVRRLYDDHDQYVRVRVKKHSITVLAHKGRWAVFEKRKIFIRNHVWTSEGREGLAVQQYGYCISEKLLTPACRMPLESSLKAGSCTINLPSTGHQQCLKLDLVEKLSDIGSIYLGLDFDGCPVCVPAELKACLVLTAKYTKLENLNHFTAGMYAYDTINLWKDPMDEGRPIRESRGSSMAFRGDKAHGLGVMLQNRNHAEAGLILLIYCEMDDNLLLWHVVVKKHSNLSDLSSRIKASTWEIDWSLEAINNPDILRDNGKRGNEALIEAVTILPALKEHGILDFTR